MARKRFKEKIDDKKKKGPNLDLDDDATGADVAPTCLRVTSLPPDVTLPELLNIMKSNHCGDIEDLGDKIMLDNSKPGTAVIKDLDKIIGEEATTASKLSQVSDFPPYDSRPMGLCC